MSLSTQQLWNDSFDKIMSLFRIVQKNFREQLFEKYRQYGYTGPQLGVIFALQKNPKITLQEVSEHMGLSKSTVSGIVERLVEQGVVQREIPKGNRRSVNLSLTEQFLKNNDLMDLKCKYFSNILEKADPKDLEDIVVGLEKLCKLMENCVEKVN